MDKLANIFSSIICPVKRKNIIFVNVLFNTVTVFMIKELNHHNIMILDILT